KGVAQAGKIAVLAKTLKLIAIYGSPKTRARMTAQPTIDATGIQATFDDGLREIGYGKWEGRKEVEIKESEPDDYALWSADPAVRRRERLRDRRALHSRRRAHPREAPERRRAHLQPQGDDPRHHVRAPRPAHRALPRSRGVPHGLADDVRVRRSRPDARPHRR